MASSYGMGRRAWLLGTAGMAVHAGCRRRGGRSPEAGPDTRVEVDFATVAGPLARLSGVQGSPLPEVEGDIDHGARFRDCGIVHARFPQDCLPNTLTLGGVFPDEHADPDRVESYRFGPIDAHVLSARAAGAEVLWQASYDVGRSDRWVGWNLGGRAPQDLQRWGRVVVRCLEHFNAGWGSGTRGAVRHVEFLNEPDGLGGFGALGIARIVPAFEAFLEGVRGYGQAHPEAPVTAVGPGIPLSLAEWEDWQPRFGVLLARLGERALPLPVFSFHSYGADTSPASNALLAARLRDLLDRSGFRATALWNTEWQATDYLQSALGSLRPKHREADARELRAYRAAVCAYAVSCKLRWQGLLQGSYYYRVNVRPWPGARRTLGADGVFFTPDGVIRPLGLQERVFMQMEQQTPLRCATAVSVDDGLVSALGCIAPDAGQACVLLCNLGLQRRTVRLRLQSPKGTPLRVSDVSELGPEADGLVPGRDGVLAGGVEGESSFELGPLTVRWIRLLAGGRAG